MDQPQVSGQHAPPIPYPCGAVGLPELENGDRLMRAEFERRYDAMPRLKKAELIKGVVYVGPPVKMKLRAAPHAAMVAWLGIYAAATPGVEACDGGSVRLDEENMPQPDGVLRILEEFGGQALVDEDDYLQGAPELVVEVASSSASYDLHDKKDIYGLFGVREYIVWRTHDCVLDWFRLESNAYVRVEPAADGIIESGVFPGLRLNVPALLADEMATVMAELQNGLASPAHAAFIEQLQAVPVARP